MAFDIYTIISKSDFRVQRRYRCVRTDDARRGLEKKDEIVLPESHSLVLKVTLLVLAKSGFGMPTSWTRPANDFDIIRSLSTVSETFLARIILPRWAYNLPFKRLHSIEKAWNDVTAFINTGIDERKAEKHEEDVDVADLPGDLLNRLVVASEDGGRYAMTEEETVANMLSLLFAGHAQKRPPVDYWQLWDTLHCIKMNSKLRITKFKSYKVPRRLKILINFNMFWDVFWKPSDSA
ncbi:hypothetical protein MPER_00774, partial [Moniliophthora perniciosa FA553]